MGRLIICGRFDDPEDARRKISLLDQNGLKTVFVLDLSYVLDNAVGGRADRELDGG